MSRRGFLRLVLPVAAASAASLDARADTDAILRVPPSLGPRALPLPDAMVGVTIDGKRYGVPLYELA